MAGLFDSVLRGLPQTPAPRNAPPWMVPAAAPQAPPPAPQAQGWYNTGGGGGSAGGAPDPAAAALQQYGPNGLLALQMYQGMMQQGPYALMDPANASKWFTPETIGGLAPRYQDAFAKQTKTKGK